MALLIRGRAGAERRAANSSSPMIAGAAGRRGRRRFSFWPRESAEAELIRQNSLQQLAGAEAFGVLALCWICIAERDRSLTSSSEGPG